jgi:hypothetical protein
MSCLGALRAVMDEGVDAMPLNERSTVKNHGTTHPTAPPSLPNDLNTFVEPANDGVMAPAAANITAPPHGMCRRWADADKVQHPRTPPEPKPHPTAQLNSRTNTQQSIGESRRWETATQIANPAQSRKDVVDSFIEILPPAQRWQHPPDARGSRSCALLRETDKEYTTINPCGGPQMMLRWHGRLW